MLYRNLGVVASRYYLFVKGLSQIAHLGGDFEVSDPETRRPFQVTTVAGFAITWWTDDPVSEVKVVDIRPTN